MNRELATVPQMSRELVQRREVRKILPFLEAIRDQMESSRVKVNREKIWDILEGIKNGYLLEELEKRPDMPYELQMQVASMTTALNKSWMRMHRIVESADMTMLFGLVSAIIGQAQNAMDYFEVEVEVKER